MGGRMSAETPPSDPLELLRARLMRGVRASALCVAVLGWLCGVPTDPSIAEVGMSWGQVMLRLSDEASPSPFGTLSEFLDEIRLLCASLGLTYAQTARVVSWARHRMG